MDRQRAVWRRLALGAWWVGACALAQADPLVAWLNRIDQADQQQSYSATVVLSRPQGDQAVELDHLCDGPNQIERVVAAQGPHIEMIRRNQDVLTLWPHQQRATRDNGARPLALRLDAVTRTALARRYRMVAEGAEVVAGLSAERLHLQPMDGWRWAYRLWLDRRTGVVLKQQALNAAGEVLEQATVTRVVWHEAEAAQRLRQTLSQRFEGPAGYAVARIWRVPTTLSAEGWTLREAPPGFWLLGCHRGVGPRTTQPRTPTPLQCVWSDGMADVSLFIDATPVAATEPLWRAWGATQLLRVSRPDGRLTAVGEVPRATLDGLLRAVVAH